MSQNEDKKPPLIAPSLYRELIDCVQEGIWKVDALGKTEFVNSVVATMLGYSTAELQETSLFDFVPSEDRRQARELVGMPEAAFCIERRFLRKNGEIRWFRVTSIPSFGLKGEFTGRTGILVDVTRQLADGDERDKFFNNSLDLIGIAGTDTFFKRLNPAFEKTLGWTVEELLAKSYLEFVHPDDLSATQPVAEELRNGFAVSSFENRYRCKDGSYKWLSWKSSPGENGLIYFVARDVTEQKKMQHALKSAVETQAALTELVQVALKSSDLQIVFQRAVNSCALTLQSDFCALTEVLPDGENMHAIAVFGWENSNITTVGGERIKLPIDSHSGFTLGQRLPVVVTDFATEKRFSSSAPIIASGVVCGVAVPVVGTGKPFGVLSVHSKLSRHFTADDLNFLVGVADILISAVERRNLESQLKTSDRMATVGLLASGVAHEINNPLSYLMTNLDLLFDRLSGDKVASTDSATLRNLTAQAQEATERVRQIVRDLKTFSAEADTELSPVDVRKVVELCLRMAGNHLRYRAKVTTDFQPSPLAFADEKRLGQVILNLLVNAAQAIPEGYVHKNEVVVHLGTDPSGRVLIEVCDTGAGIPEDVLPKIFDPFFTTKAIGVGTGLGLSICRNIILKFHGDLTIESRVDFGTRVRITLPAAPSFECSAPPGVGKARVTAVLVRRKILLLDDEALLVESLAKALAPFHDVETTTSPRKAMALILEGPEVFDFIFCDLMMAEQTGMGFFQELKLRKPGFESRVIFMTGGAFTTEARGFLETVPNARIEKPFTIAEIRKLLTAQPPAKEI